MGRPRSYRSPIKGPFDFLARIWSKGAQTKARRGNRKAFWWFSNLWYKPSHLFAVIGAIVLLLLILGEGLVAGAFCIERVGCVATEAGGIVTTTDHRVTVSLP